MEKSRLSEISEAIALAGFKIGAIKINSDNPFLWASGTYNPIYNDNRMFLWYPDYRNLIKEGFIEIINNSGNPFNTFFVVAGTSTAGIAHADRLAEALSLPEIYVRDKPKDHGLKNQIEGIDADKDLDGANVILIEDLISTGGSSVSAVAAIRKANGVCDLCLSIFNYGLPNPPKMFAGEIPYKTMGSGEELTLSSACEVKSLLYYPQLLSIGVKNGFIKKRKEKMLLKWMDDQPHWGEKNGFV